MAKSSLTFSERRRVKVLGSSIPIQTIQKEECSTVFVLAGTQGHEITLPSAEDAGEGWNCRFVVDTVQNDITVRKTTTIAAPGTDTVQAVLQKLGGTLAGGTACVNEVFNINSPVNDEAFTLTVGPAAGGTGTTFTFKIKENDAALTADNSAAGEFEISKAIGGTADNSIAEAIVRMINGDDPAGFADIEAADFRVPASGEGSLGVGIQGDLVASRTSNKKVTLTMDADAKGAVPASAVTVADVAAGDLVVGADGSIQATAAGNGGTAGVDVTGAALSTRTVVLDPSGTNPGDVLEFTVVNGVWQVEGARAE